MLTTFKTYTQKRLLWMVLAVIAIALETIALYAQHYLGLEPCNECIYIRAGILGLFIASILGLVAPRQWYVRSIALIVWSSSLIWSLYRTNILRTLEENVRNGAPSGCGRFKGFPEWLPLDQWVPAMFEPRAMCGENPQIFLSYTFADWTWFGLMVLFGATLLVLISENIHTKATS